MKIGTSLKKRQGGAVAIMVGFSIVLLIGFLAMVIDLGHLYLAKTELQNGADAAALAGVKELNGRGEGVANAISLAQQNAGKNDYDFDKPIFDTTDTPTDNDNIDIFVGTCPEDSCMVPATPTMSDTAAAGRTFLKVHTRNRDLLAWFAPVWNIFHVSTFGVAVAGPLVQDIAPLGVCALSVAGTPRQCSGPGNECGFLRGVAYNVPELNPLGMQAFPLLVNPVDVPPGSCDPNHSSADFMRPFICQGKAVGPSQIPGEVYSNTGGSWGPVETELNSRFDFSSSFGNNKCDPLTAPPDANVKSYEFNPGPLPGGGCPPGSNNVNCGKPRDWMNPDPTRQTVETVGRVPQTYNPSTVPRPNGTGTAAQWGVLWSYVKERNFGSATSGSDFDLADWPTLYSGALADSPLPGYPVTGGTSIPPYQYGLANQSSKYFLAPSVPHRPGKVDRRVLNMLVIDCDNPAFPIPGPGASCAQIRVLAIGKFFMQVPADSSGSPKKIYGEFAGLLPPGLLKPQYVLFK